MWKGIFATVFVNVIVLVMFMLELMKHQPGRYAVPLLFIYAMALLALWSHSLVDRAKMKQRELHRRMGITSYN
ncbi:MAG: hypothetical protein LLF76_03200 [Planctomycetaceae bacterium]|nr:hypothetical protein [Planctomycetaceae bacterium]